MTRYTVVLIAIVVVTFSVFGQTAPAQGDVTQISAAPDVAAAYNALAPLTRGERKAFVNGLSPATRAALWKLNAQIVVAEHPELTADQRQAVDELTDSLRPELFNIHARNRDDELDTLGAKADRDNAAQRARALLPAEVFNAIVYRIGPAFVPTTPTHTKWRIVTNDWCDCNGDPGDSCPNACYHPHPCAYIYACGLWGTDPCWGICGEP